LKRVVKTFLPKRREERVILKKRAHVGHIHRCVSTQL